MKSLCVELENCYGIKQLTHTFDFSEQNAYAIYAPNGAMKSSLARTFGDIADGTDSKDLVFPDRVCRRQILDESGTALDKSAVFVVRPYQERDLTEQTSTLLVDAALRREYEQLHVEINKSKSTFLKALEAQAQSKKNIEEEISLAFTRSDAAFERALSRIEGEIQSQADAPLAEVPYDTICDSKVLAFLEVGDSKTAIEEYIKRYNELLAASTYFRQGVFTYYNAATIAKNLAANGFFDAKHTVNLNAETKLEITSQEQLEALIQKEKENISKDNELRKKFAQIDKLIEKNIQLRDFRKYIEQHEDLLARLANIDQLKEDLWKSYIKANEEPYRDLLSKIKNAQTRKAEIEEEARKQRTQWERVIDIFNNRFFVPFKLVANNRIEVMLGEDPILNLGFTFEDGQEKASLSKTDLMAVLSTGERKALYVLNVIFEIEVRKKAHQPTVFVVDDIADSFDYKNKYAIVQYLKDISVEPYFSQIILTHNFDFFRTIESRFMRYSHCLMASKASTGIVLGPATGIRNVFVRDWKKNFFSDPRKKIASIPFIRNIIEYTRGDDDSDFGTLTSLLHWKSESPSILEGDLDAIYKATFPTVDGDSENADHPVLDLIWREADNCLDASESINFENKIVLSIAIRLAAERYMRERIADQTFVDTIKENQTSTLFERFKADFPDESETTEVLDSVVLMTPENIHLNSFMYEPILDMSDEHLRRLYTRVKAL